MRTSFVADVIIFSNDETLQKSVSDHVKMKGVSNVVQAKDAKAAMDAVKRFAKGMLVIDWGMDIKECTRTLAANRRVPDGITRPMLIICKDVSEKLVTVAAEYGVSQIFNEPDNRQALGAKLTQLMVTANQADGYKKTMQKVIKLRSKGKDDEALTSLLELYQKNPSDLRVTSELGDCLMAVGNWEKAKQILNPMKDTRPPFIRGIHLYGRCLMQEGNFKEAYAILKSANLFNPDDAERMADLGHTLLNMDKLKEANESFDKALEIDPDLKIAQDGKGQALLMAGQVNNALAIMKNNNNKREMASMFNLAAVMSMRKGRFEPGMKLYLAAIKVLGNNKQIHSRLMFNMGVGYRRWEKSDKALNCFSESLKLDPSYKKAQTHIDIINNGATATSPAIAAEEGEFSGTIEDDLDSLDFDTSFSDIDDDDDFDGMEEGITFK